MGESAKPVDIPARSDACQNRAVSASTLATTTLEKRLARFRENETRARAAAERAGDGDVRKAMHTCADSWKMLAHHVEVLIEEGAASAGTWHTGARL